MIRKKRLKKYLDKRWKGMIKNLSALSISPDRNALHKLRLHAKKIRTIELLADVHNHPFSSSIKPIVQEAGNTRAAELNLQTLKYDSYQNPALEQELQAIAENGYTCMRLNNEKYKAVIVSLSKECEEHLDDVKKQKVIIFFLAILEELGAAFIFHVQEKDLHENRKKIKHLLYAYRFLPKKLRQGMNLDGKYLDGLQEQIGTWHDLEMALVLLEQKGLNQEPVYFKIKKEQEDIYEKIRGEAKRFYKRVRNGKINL